MDVLGLLNQNTYLSAVSMIFMNLGSRYISLDISAAQEKLLPNPIVRRITIFCILYVATRDVMMSCIILAIFIFVTGHILHEDSPLSVLPSSMRGGPGPEVNPGSESVTLEEYDRAKKIIDAYEHERLGDLLAPQPEKEYTPRPRSQTLITRVDTPLSDDRPGFLAKAPFSEVGAA
jgi:hypothetical protein